MSDPVLDVPRELEEPTPPPPRRALRLLRRPDFRNLFLAVSASELGDSLHYIALMWFALDVGGPLGVVAVRLAGSIPALRFGGPRGGAPRRLGRQRAVGGGPPGGGGRLVAAGGAGPFGAVPRW